MEKFAEEAQQHLTEKLIPFWKNMRDEEHGGYYGYMDYHLNIDDKAAKGCILNSRILWFFSNAYMQIEDKSLLEYADHAYEFMKKYCIDYEFGGVYWSVGYDGKPIDTTKHTYNQAFAIYALSSYYDATGDKVALDTAENLVKLLEERCTDEYGYLEAFDRQFCPQKNDKLSENGVVAEKTMNTLLHVFEAYTEYYRVTKDKFVEKRIQFMLDLIVDKIYNSEKKRQEVFFDKRWNSLIDLHSYGHDIETAWLVDRALEVLGNEFYALKLSMITRMITENIYQKAYVSHSLINEAENGTVDTTRVWWVQAEAVVGFLNGYEKNTEEMKYLMAAKDIWNYIKEHLIDKRNGSEWYWGLTKDNVPLEKPIVEPWKCPYHNGRMCFEVMRRMQNAS